jgi:hypothetical protein
MRGGSDGGAGSVKMTSGSPSMVWKFAVSRSAAGAAAICSVRSRMSDGSGSVGAWLCAASNLASMSSTWFCVIGDGGGTGAGSAARGTSVKRGGGGGAAATVGAAGLAGALAVSSSAMMRRMEARISSIEGSCAFAD